ncbi:hypothetical protein DM860_014879 [Cuscuta australis]|uniref:Uncharacterized protein n=1 Tax=Cuscuta australis TaxID=267555 RepID=A0A328DJS2_9ASTE|nr:hypothetical protein DM860_014879 [Cuscuta australis]
MNFHEFPSNDNPFVHRFVFFLPPQLASPVSLLLSTRRPSAFSISLSPVLTEQHTFDQDH